MITQPLKIFISYSHKDEDFKKELEVHLSALKCQGLITLWHDRLIEAGTQWDPQIKAALEAAEIILLLITPRFMASDYINNIELKRAIEKDLEGTARVIPIILKPTDTKGTPISSLQALPTDAKPITTWSNQDEAFLNVVEGIRHLIPSLSSRIIQKKRNTNDVFINRQMANRTTEMAKFLRMINGQCDERIFLVEGPSGCGKTYLLLRFETECHSSFKSAWIDLKAAETGEAYVFSRICKKLGESEFPQFNQAIQQLITSNPNIRRNGILGLENTIQMVLNIQSDNSRSLRLVFLREAFFHDLRNFQHPVLLILDTFNSAPDALANWLSDSFLAEVADAPNVFAVVAGQHVPSPTGEWVKYHFCSRLGNISEVEVWYEYAKAVGLQINRDQIEMAIWMLKGQPSEIVKTFEAYAREKSR